MKQLHRVVWHKGMFLTPQHFQAQDQTLLDTLQFRLSTSSSVNWGLTDFAVDQEALANGVFALRLCRGVFSDGLAFHIPDVDAAPAGREITELFPPTQPELDVYLALPEARPHALNVTLTGAGGDAGQAGSRYLSEPHSRIDESNGRDEKMIQLARRNLRIVFGGEALDGVTSMRIAQITRNPAGTFILKPAFVPPLLSVAGSDHLTILLRRLIELLAAKAASLSLVRRQKGKNVAEFGSGDFGNFWLLHTANTFLPPLKHLWSMRRCHPEELYRILLSLGGALTTFSLDDQARSLPDYDHERLGYCFGELDEKIRHLLETAIPSRCVVIPLQQADKSIWTGMIADESHLKKSQVFLSVGAALGMDEIIRSIPTLVKISALTDVQRLVRNYLPGIKLIHTPVPPSAIPSRLDRQYFALNQSGTLWDGIVKSRQVAVFVPDEVAQPQLELLIVLDA